MTSSSSPPSGSGDMSKCSDTVARSLYGTPFLRRYPARRCDVTTLRLPPRSGAATRSQRAIDSPCQVGDAFDDGEADKPRPTGARPADGVVDDSVRSVKRSSRVCFPASVSIRSVFASCHVMCRRPGTLMMAPAPYDLHWSPARSSAAGSHALMIGSAAGEAGMRRYSPFAGVTMRYRQFSVTYDTQ